MHLLGDELEIDIGSVPFLLDLGFLGVDESGIYDAIF